MDAALAREPIAEFAYGLAQSQNNSGVPWPANVAIPYTARTALRVVVARVDQLPLLISTALSAGATSTSAPQYEFTGADSVRQTLFDAAVRKARADAQSLARATNRTLGDASTVTTYGPGAGSNTTAVNFTNRYDTGLQAILPEVLVVVTVTIQYRLMGS
jgi:uncharacterized protein YggE